MAKPALRLGTKHRRTFSLNPKLRERLVPLAVLTIVAVTSLIFSKPIYDSIVIQRRDNQQRSQEIKALQKKLAILQSAQESPLELQVEQIELVLPSHKPSLRLLSSLSKLAEEDKVLLSGITLNPGKIEQGNPLDQEETPRAKTAAGIQKLNDFTLEFAVEGKLQNIGAYVARLEKLAPVMRVEKFSLSLSKSTETGSVEDKNQVRVSFGVRVYYQEPPESLGPADQPLALISGEDQTLLDSLNQFTIYSPAEAKAPLGKQDPFSFSFGP